MVKGLRYAFGRKGATLRHLLPWAESHRRSRAPLGFRRACGPGIFFALSDNKALMAWRQTHPSWRFARVPQDWKRSIPDILSLKARLNLRLSSAELVRSRHWRLISRNSLAPTGRPLMVFASTVTLELFNVASLLPLPRSM
jgi:hypothetical protein